MTNIPKIEQYHLHKLHPEKLQFEVYDLKMYRTKSGQKAAVPHSHSYYQVIWFFEAGGTHIVDFRTYTIQKDTVLFITKDQVHAFDENLDMDGWLIHFNESFFMHSEVDMFLKYNIFTRLGNPCFYMDFKTAVTFSNYIGIVNEEMEERGRFGYELVIRFLLKSLLITLERNHQEEEAFLSPSNNYQLKFFEFKELVEVKYREGLNIQSYADLLNVSTKTLGTITNRVVGHSPSQIVKERIVLEAKRFLRFTSLQLGEIAFNLGFEDVSYFVRYFKREVGSTPIQFRESKNKPLS